MDQPRVLRMHAVDLKQLRFAVAAADYGSIRQAAELLSIRHSILSRSIRQLEHRIGVTVFARPSFAFNVERLELAGHAFSIVESVLRTHGQKLRFAR
jgi:DNA-binding transcriptional LysR family regulator